MHPIVSGYIAEERDAELRRLARQAGRHRRARAPRSSLRRWSWPGRMRDVAGGAVGARLILLGKRLPGRGTPAARPSR